MCTLSYKNWKKDKPFNFADPTLQFTGYAQCHYNGGRGCGKTFRTNQIAQNVHAEICPVCNGSGKYIEYHFARGQSTGKFDYHFTRPCHGCDGKGWVVIATVYGLR